MSREHRARRRSLLGGFALAFAGMGVIFWLLAKDRATLSTVEWWVVGEELSPRRLLPLAGFAIALSMLDYAAVLVTSMSFCIGLISGTFLTGSWYQLLSALPHAVANDFFVVPIADLAAGLALLAGDRVKGSVVVACGFLVGATAAIEIELSDPTLHSLSIKLAGYACILWFVLTSGIMMRAARGAWLPIGSRIAGSWLVAIGLLYGASSMLSNGATLPLPPPVSNAPAERMSPSRLDRLLPEPGLKQKNGSSKGSGL